MSKLTPIQVSRIFGCSVDQAAAHIEKNAKALKDCAQKAKQANNGKHRGISANWYEQKAANYEQALKANQ